jgi:hypothetical protein
MGKASSLTADVVAGKGDAAAASKAVDKLQGTDGRELYFNVLRACE